MIFDLDYIVRASTPEPNTGCWLWTGNVTDALRVLVDGKDGEFWE